MLRVPAGRFVHKAIHKNGEFFTTSVDNRHLTLYQTQRRRSKDLTEFIKQLPNNCRSAAQLPAIGAGLAYPLVEPVISRSPEHHPSFEHSVHLRVNVDMGVNGDRDPGALQQP